MEPKATLRQPCIPRARLWRSELAAGTGQPDGSTGGDSPENPYKYFSSRLDEGGDLDTGRSDRGRRIESKVSLGGDFGRGIGGRRICCRCDLGLAGAALRLRGGLPS